MKRIMMFVVIALALCLSGCTIFETLPDHFKYAFAFSHACTPDGQDQPIPIAGEGGYSIPVQGMSPWVRKCMIDDLPHIPPETQRSILTVKAYQEDFIDFAFEDLSYYRYHFDDANAHCESDRTICILAPRAYRGLMVHEAAHARTFELGRGKRAQWIETAKFSYVSKWRKSLPNGPENGVLTPYGALNELEDIAEYAQCVAYFMRGNDRIFGKVDITKDSRFLKKLRLVHEFRIITDRAYAAVFMRLTFVPIVVRLHPVR